MRSQKLFDRILAAETNTGLKERFVAIFNKDYDETAQYYFEIDENENKIYYKDGKVISLDELEQKFMDIVSINVEFVKSNQK